MEVSFTVQESRWGFGHTGNVSLSSSAQRSPAVNSWAKPLHRHTTRTPKRGRLLPRLVHAQTLFSQTQANFSMHTCVSVKGRLVLHQQLKQFSFSGTADTAGLKQSSPKHTFHCAGLRSHCEERMSAQEGCCLVRELQFCGYLHFSSPVDAHLVYTL